MWNLITEWTDAMEWWRAAVLLYLLLTHTTDSCGRHLATHEMPESWKKNDFHGCHSATASSSLYFLLEFLNAHFDFAVNIKYCLAL